MRNILVVDDDRLTRWALERVLTRAGYRVREARSAAEGVACTREDPPDLIFLDVCLPDDDNVTVLQTLHELRPEVPVVMMSADATHEVGRRLCEFGARAYVEKPCAPALVLALAEALLPRGG
jgi:DNA-binding response OmpR family regulator